MTDNILFCDIETTGPEPSTARIISAAFVRGASRHVFLVNPGMPIPPESTAIHGFTDESVSGWPVFSSIAGALFDTILSPIFSPPAAVAGFNLLAFDLPVLWAHLHEAGIEWDVSKLQVIDVGLIFKLKEPRGLAAAVEFYCGRKHDGAHEAMTDTVATRDVLVAQMERYQDLAKMPLPDLAKFSRGDAERIDFAGKILRDADGDAVYGFGKSKGTKMKHDLGLAYWILDRDFPEQTKFCIREEIKRIDEEEKSAKAALPEGMPF